MRPLGPSSILLGVAAIAVAWAVGAGPANGDVVAYLAQARALDLLDRGHPVYVALLTPLARLPEPFLALDLLSAAAVAAAAFAGPNPGVAALALAPIAATGEVDPVWIALLAWSARVPWLAALSAGTSPSAILALPAVRRGWPWAVGAVVVLILATGGDWIWGHRGVLHDPRWLPGKVLARWAVAFPWALVPLVRWDADLRRDLLACAPLLLLPPDVPGWAVPALRLARNVDTDGPLVWLGLQLVLSVRLLHADTTRIREENATIAVVAATLAEGDGVLAPFSWGARVSFAASGDPYGIPWHPPGAWLRDQERQWAEAAPDRVWVLPPGPGGLVSPR